MGPKDSAGNFSVDHSGYWYEYPELKPSAYTLPTGKLRWTTTIRFGPNAKYADSIEARSLPGLQKKAVRKVARLNRTLLKKREKA